MTSEVMFGHVSLMTESFDNEHNIKLLLIYERII